MNYCMATTTNGKLQIAKSCWFNGQNGSKILEKLSGDLLFLFRKVLMVFFKFFSHLRADDRQIYQECAIFCAKRLKDSAIINILCVLVADGNFLGAQRTEVCHFPYGVPCHAPCQ